MSGNNVLVKKVEDGVAYVILNSPETRNAISVETIENLNQSLDELDQDDDVRVIILTGQGDHFCSGGELRMDRELSSIEVQHFAERLTFNIKKIISLEKPVIAMVQGYAAGGGVGYALAGDVVYASEDAKFTQSFLKLNLIPDLGCLCFLPIAVGLHRAKELMLSGEIVHAHEACQMGMVNQVFPKERLEEETLAFARRIAAQPPVAMGMMKRILNKTFLNQLESVLEHETMAQSICFNTKDHKEAVAAFVEKRKPHFNGK